MNSFFVYLMTNQARTALYTGVTNNLARRVSEHQRREFPGFTKYYHCTRLVYFDVLPDALSAIAFEKQVKGWTRARKNALVGTCNPKWTDISGPLFEPVRGPSLRSG